MVVDLHLFLAIELALDARLEILKSKLLLHGGTIVRGVTDETSLDNLATIILSSFEIVCDVARVVSWQGCSAIGDTCVPGAD